MSLERMLLGVLLAGSVWALARPTVAADLDLAIPSRTLQDDDFLRGDVDAGTATEISGRFAGAQDGGLDPAIILLHGTDGPKSGAAGNWSQYLNAQGFVTLRLDSYTARGIANASTDQGAAPQFSPVHDAYPAVELLAETPGIDRDRIYLMGFSRGGSATLHAGLQRFHEAFGPRSGRIAGYLAFYPACNFTLEREFEVVDAPIRVFHGGADDWTPVASCRDYVERLVAEGRDASLTELPGVHHAFDNPSAPALHSEPEWRTSRACHRVERDGQMLNGATGDPFTYEDACVERGPHNRYDAASLRRRRHRGGSGRSPRAIDQARPDDPMTATALFRQPGAAPSQYRSSTSVTQSPRRMVSRRAKRWPA